MIVAKIKNKNSMVSVLILICFSTLQDDIEAKPTQPTVKLDLFMNFFFWRNCSCNFKYKEHDSYVFHMYFGWDQSSY